MEKKKVLRASSTSNGFEDQFDVSWAASGPGTLVYLSGKGSARKWQVAFLESSGKLQPLTAAAGTYVQPRFSPEGRKLAFMNDGDIYVYDLERNTTTRLTFTGNAAVPVWVPVRWPPDSGPMHAI